MVKYLIANADDFGLNDCRDDAIIKLLHDKLITSATVMINQDNSSKTIQYINQKKLECCGIHLTLNRGRSAFESSRNVDLDLTYSKNYFKFLLNYLFYKKEIDSQIATATKSWDVSHLDGHLHIHTFPLFYSTIIKSMKINNLNKIRNCFSLLKNNWSIKSQLKKYYRNTMKRNKFSMPDFLFDINDFFNNINNIFELPDDSVIEVVCHPEITGNQDYNILTSAEYHKILSKFETISYNDLSS